MLMIELPMATPPLAMTAAYKETDVIIRIRPNRYYSAKYRIDVHPTIRPRSEYEANIRYSPTLHLTFAISKGGVMAKVQALRAEDTMKTATVDSRINQSRQINVYKAHL